MQKGYQAYAPLRQTPTRQGDGIGAATRWGSCNAKTGKIWLNLQLAKKTPECLEYVILHELIHLVVKNHGEKFSLMDKHMPMWRETGATLNKQTLDYMEKSNPGGDDYVSNR